MSDLAPSSPRQARRQRELELRRADILAAATEVFAERGFEGAQVSEIASRAEVSLATIYVLFDNKEGLYRALLQEVSLDIFARVGELVKGIEDPVENLLAMVDALCHTFEAERGFLHLFVHDTTAMPWRVGQSMGEKGTAIFDQFCEWVAVPARRARRQGRLRVMSPETFAHFLLGAVATTLLRSVEADPERSLLELGAELRAGIERVFEEPKPRAPRRRRKETT